MSDQKSPHIALLMMVKNEEKRIEASLSSCLGIVKSIVIYDTGSTDKTLEIIKNFCTKNKVTLRLKIGEFVDFSTSRNVSLDFADLYPEIDYLLLLDSNDELKGGKYLLKFAKEDLNKSGKGASAFYICQQWKYGNRIDKYFNTRFIKPRRGWRYKGVVHEYMDNKEMDEKRIIFRLPDDIFLFQDRAYDGEKSVPRFQRDKELLLNEYLKDKKDSRTLFYLAQTCNCLGLPNEAYYYYRLRSYQDDFLEEKFLAYHHCGKISKILGHEWKDSVAWFTKAFETLKRVEPLIEMAEHYISKNDNLSAWMYLKTACKLDYPNDALLFVDRIAYDYKRWHLMGRVAFYVNEFEDGLKACQKAIAQGTNVELDTKNMKFYKDKLGIK